MGGARFDLVLQPSICSFPSWAIGAPRRVRQRRVAVQLSTEKMAEKRPKLLYTPQVIKYSGTTLELTESAELSSMMQRFWRKLDRLAVWDSENDTVSEYSTTAPQKSVTKME